jgi:hypothetical protein
MGWGLRDYNRTGHMVVCFKDRFTAKQVARHNGTGPTTNTSACPICRERMIDMGKDFKPPRKNDDREWKRIQTGMMLGLGYWSRQTPRQLHLISEKRKRVREIEKTLKGRQTNWRWYNYNPDLV